MVDRRFGEDDPQITLEDRMLKRFTKQRQNDAKRSQFNLEDDEMQPYGQSLLEDADFDEMNLHLPVSDNGSDTSFVTNSQNQAAASADQGLETVGQRLSVL